MKIEVRYWGRYYQLQPQHCLAIAGPHRALHVARDRGSHLAGGTPPPDASRDHCRRWSVHRRVVHPKRRCIVSPAEST